MMQPRLLRDALGRLGLAGDQELRHQLRGQARTKLQIAGAVEPAREIDGSRACQQLAHQRDVFAEPNVTIGMGLVVAQSLQVADRRPRDHVEIDLAAVDLSEGRNEFRGRERVHVERIDGDQGRASRRLCHDVLGHRPGLDEHVIAFEQQDAFEAVAVGEPGHPHQLAYIGLGIAVA
ncbi:hypothetical protein ABIF91_005270 [Bradyrhizobium sp. USDA 241]